MNIAWATLCAAMAVLALLREHAAFGAIFSFLCGVRLAWVIEPKGKG